MLILGQPITQTALPCCIAIEIFTLEDKKFFTGSPICCCIFYSNKIIRVSYSKSPAISWVKNGFLVLLGADSNIQRKVFFRCYLTIAIYFNEDFFFHIKCIWFTGLANKTTCHNRVFIVWYSLKLATAQYLHQNSKRLASVVYFTDRLIHSVANV